VLVSHSLLKNQLGNGADTLMAAARELPQLITLCGIQLEQKDVNLQNQRLDAGDAKLLAFDLKKNQTIKTLKCTCPNTCRTSRPCEHLHFSCTWQPGRKLPLRRRS